MIKTFKDNEGQLIFLGEVSKKLPFDIQQTAWRKLLMLDAATNINDLRVPPGNCLELLKGNRAGQYSIRINRQWRVCFTWRDNNAYEVEIIDYH